MTSKSDGALGRGIIARSVLGPVRVLESAF